MTTIKILLVEDDLNLSFILQDHLERQGYELKVCENGLQGLETFVPKKFDLCILDVMLPLLNGFSLASQIRKVDENVPIFFLSALAQKDDKIKGLQIGADDYITKPFSLEELDLRIKAVLKRTQALKLPPTTSISIGKYTFDYKNLSLEIPDYKLQLTQKESEVLLMLVEHAETVLKREHILRTIWGTDDYFIGRSLDVFISRLRKYLKHDSHIEIVNIHGIGFKLMVRKDNFLN